MTPEHEPTLTRRQLLRRTFYGGMLAAAASYGYGRAFERRHIVTQHVSVTLPRLPTALHGLKIAQLSDLHLHPYTEPETIARAVQVTNALQPDLILLTGDFITYKGSDAEELGELLRPLQSQHGIFGCMGNHDCWYQPWLVRQHLTASGVEMLENAGSEITAKSEKLWLGGLDSIWAGRPVLSKALPRSSGIPAIMLVHEPDYADILANTSRPLLQLSGHSHGGQVRVPFMGAPVTVPWAKKYIRGLYQVGDVTLYVNSGIGCTSHPVRFACPPEVTLLTLKAAA